MSWLTSLLSGDYLIWILLAGALFGVLGLSGIVKPIGVFVEAVSPLLKGAAEGIVTGVKWTVGNIVVPGLKDIFDNWSTAVLVIGSALILYWGVSTNLNSRIDQLTDDLGTCQTEMTKLKKQYKQAPNSGFLWPLW